MPLALSGDLLMPHRYADASKSRCFAHGNVHMDLKRAIKVHPTSKSHIQALKLNAQQGQVLEAVVLKDKGWQHAALLAFRHLVRLSASMSFTDACQDTRNYHALWRLFSQHGLRSHYGIPKLLRIWVADTDNQYGCNANSVFCSLSIQCIQRNTSGGQKLIFQMHVHEP
jgi:hypothetical protein